MTDEKPQTDSQAGKEPTASTASASPTSQAGASASAGNARLNAILMSYRHIGMPLLAALAKAPAGGGQRDPELKPEQFTALIEASVLLDQEMVRSLGGDDNAMEPWVRWALAGAASQVVAAQYQGNGQVLSAESAKHISAMVGDLQENFKILIPATMEATPNTVATFRAKMLETMVPVIGAVAQYSFGRAEHSLLAEVSERLIKTADQVTRALAPAGSTPDQWRFLCWHILRASGQIYTDSHYAEADRLLYMTAEERAQYFANNGNIVPMVQVWQAFNQRMAMLATLASYLDLPPTVGFDSAEWA